MSISYLLVYNSHNGSVLKVPKPIPFHTLNEFKTYIGSSFQISNNVNLFILTSFGIKLNFNIVNELNELFIYDKSRFSTTESSQPMRGIPQNESNKETISILNTLFKSMTTLFQFLTNFIIDIEKNFNTVYNYVKLIQSKTLNSSWEHHYENLKSFPVVKLNNVTIKLHQMLNLNQLKQYSAYIKENLPKIISEFEQMNKNISVITKEKLHIDSLIDELRNDSIMKFKNQTTNDPSQSDLTQLTNFKSHLLTQSNSIYSSIANTQMKMVSVKTQLRNYTSENTGVSSIEMIKNYEDYLSLTIDLPLLFGFIMIEQRRQYEWSDFYSKGIINNVVEQLTIIIEHEKLFRNLWIKKFANFLKLLNEPLSTTLPSIDVSLNNNTHSQSNILKNVIVERKDIENYISTLSYNKNFQDLMSRNYHDLITSTDNMKQLTKKITSLSVVTKENFKDDLSIVSNLQKHINRLEYLLHQQEMKKLSSWPPSMKLDNDPTKLLQKLPLKNSSHSQLLDSSIVDKHLNQIKLKKENEQNFETLNKQLKSEIDQLKSTNNEKDKQIETNQAEIEHLTKSNKSLQEEVEKLKSELTNTQTTINQLSSDKSDLITKNNNLQTDLEHLELKTSSIEHQNLNEFCLVLESMGLLLVNENDTYTIKRVKGLKKSKKSESSQLTPVHHSKALDELTLDSLPTEIKQSGFFYNAINKRFQDVENFAKQQMKENKKLKDVVNRL